MATWTECVNCAGEWSAVSSDSVVIDIHVEPTDTVTTTGEAYPGFTDAWTDTVVSSGDGFEIYEYTSTATSSSSVSLVSTMRVTRSDAVDGSDEYVWAQATSYTDTVAGSDATTLSYVLSYEDDVAVTETYTITQTPATDYTDTVVSAGTHSIGWAEAWTDSVTSSHTSFPIQDMAVTIDDVDVTSSGDAVQSMSICVTYEDDVTAADTWAVTLTASWTATDTVVATDYYTFVDVYYSAFLMNTESVAGSTYMNFPIDSVVQSKSTGVSFGAGPEGIYKLEGSQDGSTDVDAEVVLGMTDFGIQQKKRVDSVFVGYTGGPIELGVEALHNDRSAAEYSYEVELREADIPRNDRMKPGKGATGRYWRFTLRNVDGSDFNIDSLSADVAISKRRI